MLLILLLEGVRMLLVPVVEGVMLLTFELLKLPLQPWIRFPVLGVQFGQDTSMVA